MAKSRRERCPYCGFLDTIKWGKQSGHQRYKCKNCGSLFTARRKDVSHKNRFACFYLLALILCAASCGTVQTLPVQDSTHTEVKVVEKIVRDTAYIELPVIVEKVVTLDTVSVLENRYAKSEASVSAGLLSHSLATKPVKELVVVEVREVVRDSIVWRDRIVERPVEVERELTPWQSMKMMAGGMGVGIAIVCIFLIIIYLLFHSKFFKL